MTDEKVRACWDEAKKRVHVSCNEYHQHSANSGCLSGPEDAVNVCRLAEAFLAERGRLREIVKGMET